MIAFRKRKTMRPCVHDYDIVLAGAVPGQDRGNAFCAFEDNAGVADQDTPCEPCAGYLSGGRTACALTGLSARAAAHCATTCFKPVGRAWTQDEAAPLQVVLGEHALLSVGRHGGWAESCLGRALPDGASVSTHNAGRCATFGVLLASRASVPADDVAVTALGLSSGLMLVGVAAEGGGVVLGLHHAQPMHQPQDQTTTELLTIITCFNFIRAYPCGYCNLDVVFFDSVDVTQPADVPACVVEYTYQRGPCAKRLFSSYHNMLGRSQDPCTGY